MIKQKLGMLQYVKTLKKLISKFNFPVELYQIRENIIIQNCLLQKYLQIRIATFFYKIYIILVNLKKIYYGKSKIQFF